MTTIEAPRITTREKEILQYIAEGKTAFEIGTIFGISQHTVRGHTERMMRKFGVYKDTALIATAFRSGIIE